MMKLINQTQNTTLSTELNLATGFWNRFVGMMGKENFPTGYALKIEKCNWVHTCFMKTPIDLIFLDKEGEIKELVWNMAEWRFSPMVWKADSVIEFPAGALNKASVAVGDRLYVEP